jgi:molybdopterin molybdotransferase
MLSESAAHEQVLSRVAPLPSECAPLVSSLGHALTHRQIATHALPGFDNSQVDGYGVRASEAHTSTRLIVHGEQPAGPLCAAPLPPRCAVRIFTGAPIPIGVDAIIMQEDVTREGEHIIVHEPTASGDFIRRAGSDLAAGQIIAEPGTPITPALIGVLAAQGLSEVLVHRQPSIAVLTTGDELMPPGTPLSQGQLFNSNGPMLAAMLRQLGINTVNIAHCRDDRVETTQVIGTLLAEHDVVIIAGGVSVGDHDHVRPALLQLGIAPELWRVKVKPGKPFLFARSDAQRPCYVFGLPGNPVSAFVTFHLFVRPALMKMMGHQGSALELPTIPATLAAAVTNDGDRPHYIRGVLERGDFRAVGMQQSHALHGLSRCNAMLRVPEHSTLAAGSVQPVHLT